MSSPWSSHLQPSTPSTPQAEQQSRLPPCARRAATGPCRPTLPRGLRAASAPRRWTTEATGHRNRRSSRKTRPSGKSHLLSLSFFLDTERERERERRKRESPAEISCKSGVSKPLSLSLSLSRHREREREGEREKNNKREPAISWYKSSASKPLQHLKPIDTPRTWGNMFTDLPYSHNWELLLRKKKDLPPQSARVSFVSSCNSHRTQIRFHAESLGPGSKLFLYTTTFLT